MAISYNLRPLTDGLVYYLDAANPRCYSGTGTTAFDLKGSIAVSLVNGVGFGTSNNGNFIFDGSNDYIFSNLTSAMNESSLTWCVWYKSSSDTAQTLISKSSFVANTSFDLSVGPSTVTLTNELITIIGIDNNNRVGYVTTNRNELFDNNWHHIVFTAQPSSYQLFLDTRNLTLTTGQGSNNGNVVNVSDVLSIGSGIRQGVLNVPTLGNISNVQIYNRALSASEIRQLYNATKGRYGL